MIVFQESLTSSSLKSMATILLKGMETDPKLKLKIRTPINNTIKRKKIKLYDFRLFNI